MVSVSLQQPGQALQKAATSEEGVQTQHPHQNEVGGYDNKINLSIQLQMLSKQSVQYAHDTVDREIFSYTNIRPLNTPFSITHTKLLVVATTFAKTYIEQVQTNKSVPHRQP